ncbi:MAG: hypothetical protein ABI867_45000 [Kofleriaceae bacterium]
MDLAELVREPSPESWRRLCEALDRMETAAALAAIAQLEPALEAWPDELRATMCGMTWDDEFFAGTPNPRSTIVRYLRFDRTFSGRYDFSMRVRGRDLTPATMRAMCGSDGVRHLTRVHLGYQLDAPGVVELAQCAYFERLAWLNLNGCAMSRDALSELAQAEFFGRLDMLSLYNCKITDDFVDALFDSRGAPRSLSLSSNAIGTAGARVIATGIHSTTRRLEVAGCELDADAAAALATIESLVELEIGGNAIGDAGLERLTGGALRLSTLEITGDSIGTDGIRTLCDSGWPLAELVLRDNAIDDAAALYLAAHGPRTLAKLDLHDNDLSARGLAALIDSERLANLRELDVSANRIGAHDRLAPAMRGLVALRLAHNRLGDGIRALAAIESDTLRDLNLAHNAIDAAAFQELTGASWFGGLATLDLRGNPLGVGAGVLFGAWPIAELVLSSTGLGDDGVAALVASGLHPKTLELDDCDLGDAALEAIADSPICERLEILSVRRNRITDRGVQALVDRAPRRLTQIRFDRNLVGDAGVIALAQWPQLLHVGAANNPFGKPGEAALEALPSRCCP